MEYRMCLCLCSISAGPILSFEQLSFTHVLLILLNRFWFGICLVRSFHVFRHPFSSFPFIRFAFEHLFLCYNLANYIMFFFSRSFKLFCSLHSLFPIYPPLTCHILCHTHIPNIDYFNVWMFECKHIIYFFLSLLSSFHFSFILPLFLLCGALSAGDRIYYNQMKNRQLCNMQMVALLPTKILNQILDILSYQWNQSISYLYLF